MLRTSLIAGALGAVVFNGIALAADGPHDKAIKARQSMFQILSFSSGVLGDMAKGKAEYNPDLAAELAANLNAAANLGQSAYWPEGSGQDNAENASTRSLPDIWESFEDFEGKFQQLRDASAVLAAEAGNGADALKASLGDVGKSCKGCHDNYRGKRQ